MNRLELENEVLAHGFKAQTYRPRIRRWLNDGVKHIRRNSEIAAAEATQSITTVVGTANHALDELVVRPRWIRHPGETSTLEQWDLRDIDESAAASGKPFAFAYSGRNLVFYPTPDAAYSLELRHYASAADMADDDDEPELPEDYHPLLVPFALSRAYRSEDDAEMSVFYWNEFVRDFASAKGDLQRGKPPRQVPGMWATRRGPSFVRP